MATKRKQFFVPLAVDYAADDKIIEAGPMAELLYVRSLAFAKRTVTNGLIKRAQLNVVGLGLTQLPKHAQTLVDVGLWTATHDGHWVISAWLKHNQSTGEFDAQTLAGKKANHARWKHSGPAETCPICMSDSDSDRTPIGSESESKDRRELEREVDGEEIGYSSHDDYQSENTPIGSSSSDFEAVIKVISRAALSRAKSKGKSIEDDDGWLNGTRKNMRTEAAHEVTSLLDAGMTVPDAAASIIGDPSLTRWALRQEKLSHIAEVAS